MKQFMIKIGNFFFKYRNKAFPILVATLFALAVPKEQIFGSHFLEGMKDYLAVAVGIAGLVVRGSVIGLAYIKRGGLNKEVYADKLVTEGMFQLCRNPLYLGNMLICIAVFLMHSNPVVFVTGVGVYLFIYYSIIFAEEAYLSKKFGAEYEAYCRNTPRWIPILSRYSQATAGMNFNIKRVLIKDYTTIAVTACSLMLAEIYEEAMQLRDVVSQEPQHIATLVSGIVLAAVFVVVVRVLKKKKILVEA